MLDFIKEVWANNVDLSFQYIGRLFVYHEELQIFSEKEWSEVDSELKDMITDNWGSYTDKYEKPLEADTITVITIWYSQRVFCRLRY